MKIAIATVQVPFIRGGAEVLTEMLKNELIKRGINTDIVSIPFKWYPKETLLDSMLIGRMIDIREVNGEKIDRVIAMKFPAYYLKHDNKVLWLMHQHRQAYDLWETPFGDLHNTEDGNKIRKFISDCDNRYLLEFRKVYTIAMNTGKRLLEYNGINSETLYHPPLGYEKMRCEKYGDFIFYPSRIAPMKRQRVLVEAAKYVKTDVRFIIAGLGEEKETKYLQKQIQQYHLETKVKLCGFISEEEKINYYANCLAVYFGAYDEDYGYITLEGFFSKKPVIVHEDAGGPLEFVIDNENGFVLPEDPKVLAEKIDELYANQKKARAMGEKGWETLKKKNMNWDYVIEKLLD